MELKRDRISNFEITVARRAKGKSIDSRFPRPLLEREAFRPAGPTISRPASPLIKSPKGRFFLIGIGIECRGGQSEAEFRERGGDTENDHRRRGTDGIDDPWIRTSIFHIYDDVANITSLRDLAARDAIPADRRTSFSRALITSLHRSSDSYRGDYIPWINILTRSLWGPSQAGLESEREEKRKQVKNRVTKSLAAPTQPFPKKKLLLLPVTPRSVRDNWQSSIAVPHQPPRGIYGSTRPR